MSGKDKGKTGTTTAASIATTDDNGCDVNNKFYLVSLILVVKQHRSELDSGFSELRKTHLIVYVPCRVTKKRERDRGKKAEYKLAKEGQEHLHITFQSAISILETFCECHKN